MQENLTAKAYRLRQHVLDIIMAGKGGHIGGDMSVIDVLVTLYFDQMNISPENQNDPNRDLFVLSKGHAVEAYYAVLAEKGFFPYEEVLAKFSKFGSPFIGHPNNKLPGIEMNSGSLGHGLPVSIGMALAAGVLCAWQGAISALTLLLGDFISATMMTELSIVGGALIVMSGLSILKVKDFKTLDFLPALAVPVVWCLLAPLLGI